LELIVGFPLKDAQTGLYVKEGFEELGHKVVAINDPRVFPGPEQILILAEEYKPDFIFIAKDPRYNNIIEELTKKFIVAMWNVDVRYDINDFLSTCGPLYKYCQLKFTIEKGNLEKYKKAGIENIYWLSEGISPKWHTKTPCTMDDMLKYVSEISFTGNILGLQEGRQELINKLKELPGFKHFNGIFNLEHNKLCQISKINIGHSGWPKVELSMSARDYRIMGAGGFLLTNHVEGIENWFEVGKMCDTYKSPEECVEKIKYYLENYELRKQIAEYGYRAVQEKHKFSDRLKEIVEHVRRIKGAI